MVIAQGTTGDFRIHHRLLVFPLTFITFSGCLELRVAEGQLEINHAIKRANCSSNIKAYKQIKPHAICISKLWKYMTEVTGD